MVIISYAGDSAKSKPSFAPKNKKSSQGRGKGTKVSCQAEFLCKLRGRSKFTLGHCSKRRQGGRDMKPMGNGGRICMYGMDRS